MSELILRVKDNLKILLGALLDSHDEQENFKLSDRYLTTRWEGNKFIVSGSSDTSRDTEGITLKDLLTLLKRKDSSMEIEITTKLREQSKLYELEQEKEKFEQSTGDEKIKYRNKPMKRDKYVLAEIDYICSLNISKSILDNIRKDIENNESNKAILDKIRKKEFGWIWLRKTQRQYINGRWIEIPDNYFEALKVEGLSTNPTKLGKFKTLTFNLIGNTEKKEKNIDYFIQQFGQWYGYEENNLNRGTNNSIQQINYVDPSLLVWITVVENYLNTINVNAYIIPDAHTDNENTEGYEKISKRMIELNNPSKREIESNIFRLINRGKRRLQECASIPDSKIDNIKVIVSIPCVNNAEKCMLYQSIDTYKCHAFHEDSDSGSAAIGQDYQFILSWTSTKDGKKPYRRSKWKPLSDRDQKYHFNSIFYPIQPNDYARLDRTSRNQWRHKEALHNNFHGLLFRDGDQANLMNALKIIRDTEKCLALIVEGELTKEQENTLNQTLLDKKGSISAFPRLVQQYRQLSEVNGDNLWFFLFNPYLIPPTEAEDYLLFESQEQNP